MFMRDAEIVRTALIAAAMTKPARLGTRRPANPAGPAVRHPLVRIAPVYSGLLMNQYLQQLLDRAENRWSNDRAGMTYGDWMCENTNLGDAPFSSTVSRV